MFASKLNLTQFNFNTLLVYLDLYYINVHYRNEDVRYLNESAVDSVCEKLSVVTELAEQLDFTLSGLAQSTVTRVLDDSSGSVTQVSLSMPIYTSGNFSIK